TSLFALHLAACLSAGSPWPDGTPCPQGNVLLIAPHDSVSDTIKPRLEAAGADTSHIFFLPHIADTSPSPTRRFRPSSFPAPHPPASALCLFQHSLLRNRCYRTRHSHPSLVRSTRSLPSHPALDRTHPLVSASIHPPLPPRKSHGSHHQ